MSPKARQVQLFFSSIVQCLSLAIVLAVPCASQQTVENKKVLILFNNDSYTATQTAIDRALRSTLKGGSPAPVETYSEYVGNTRAGTGYEKEFVALLQQK